MKTLILKRFSSTIDGTFGVMFDDMIPFIVTLERKWLDNRSGESCIPNGEYICRRIVSPHFGETFEVTNVTGRSHILLHKGNLEDDSHGCILIGEQYEPMFDKKSGTFKNAVLSSGKGFSEFMDKLKGQETFILDIKWTI